MGVYSSIIHKTQKVETTQISINWWTGITNSYKHPKPNAREEVIGLLSAHIYKDFQIQPTSTLSFTFHTYETLGSFLLVI